MNRQRTVAPSLRPAQSRDSEFAYRVSKEVMKDHVEATLGPWDEKEQRLRFEQDFAEMPHEIIDVEGEDVGLWSVMREPIRLVLRKVYILPEHQRQGLGTALLRRLINDSERSRLPIELRYLSVNPVGPFYERFGFVQFKEESPFIYLRRSRVL